MAKVKIVVGVESDAVGEVTALLLDTRGVDSISMEMEDGSNGVAGVMRATRKAVWPAGMGAGAGRAVPQHDARIDDDGEDAPQRTARGTRTVRMPQRGNSRPGTAVVYSVAGGKRDQARILETLTPKSLSAFVYRDLIKHPESRNADVRVRADKAGYNAESVDNVIWKHVQTGAVSKAAAE